MHRRKYSIHKNKLSTKNYIKNCPISYNVTYGLSYKPLKLLLCTFHQACIYNIIGITSY